MHQIRPAKPTESKPLPPRSVRVSCGTQADDRVKVLVKVLPTCDLDAGGGVFVDLLLATTDHATRHAAKPATPTPDATRPGAPPAVLSGQVAKAPPRRSTPIGARTSVAGGHAHGKKRAITSHQIAPAQHLVMGQSERFRSEIALPAASAAGWSWFVRGRFATADGEDLRSKWVRVI